MSRMQRDATGGNDKKMPLNAADAFVRLRNDLSERQRIAVQLLLQGQTDEQVGAQLRVDRTTIFRWRKHEAFAREMDRQRSALMEQSTSQLQSMLPIALKLLQKQLSSSDEKIALRAAALLIRVATPGRLRAPSASEDARAVEKQQVDDLFDYINAPMPGQPGAPGDPANFEGVDEDPT